MSKILIKINFIYFILFFSKNLLFLINYLLNLHNIIIKLKEIK